MVSLSVDKASELFYSGRLGSLDYLSRPAHLMLNRTYYKCLYKARQPQGFENIERKAYGLDVKSTHERRTCPWLCADCLGPLPFTEALIIRCTCQREAPHASHTCAPLCHSYQLLPLSSSPALLADKHISLVFYHLLLSSAFSSPWLFLFFCC